MQKRIFIIFFIILFLVTGCSHSAANTTSAEETSPHFAIPTSPESDSAVSSEETQSEEYSTEAPETSSENDPVTSSEEPTEEPSEESSSESMPTTAPTETLPEETREILEFIPVNEQVTATASVNMRDDYSLEGNIITVLHRGDTITRIGYHEQWSKVLYNGEEYFISSKYLTTETLPPETQPPETTEAPITAPVIFAPEFNDALFSNLSSLSFNGRWFTKDYDGYTHYTTLNAGSELSFQINGTNCFSIFLSTLSGSGGYFAYSIDGQSPVRQSIDQPAVPLGSSGSHTVRIIIDSIGEFGNRWDEGTGISIDGIALNGGTLSPWQYSNTVIAFYGDSITEGIRTLSASEHSYISSYTWYCSQSLNAQPVVCGFPGSGITTTGTFNTCANAVTNYSSGRGASDFNPSVVVLSHGTNDLNTDNATFSDAYNQVLDLLHTKFPNAVIVCMIPPAQTHADDIRNCVSGKDWCAVVETSGWAISYTDNIHPDASSSYNMGTNLASSLQSFMR